MMSKTGVHALRALSALAKLSNGDYAGSGEVAQAIGAPRNYLGKLLKTLSHGGLVESKKGKGGGFRLSRDPATITLLDVMEPVARVGRWKGCFMGQTSCSTDALCSLHSHWAQVRDAYFQFLRETTVADLATQFVPSSQPIDD